MARRSHLSQIGITKKDQDEMAGCMVAIIFIPIYLIVDGIKIFSSIITSVFKFINQKATIQQKEDNNYDKNKIVPKRKVYTKNKTIIHKIPPSEFRVYKDNNDLILENDYFKLEYFKIIESDFIFNYILKWNNGSYLGGNFGVNKPIYDKPFDLENYNLYFYNLFNLVKKKYKNEYNKEYDYFDNNPFKKDTN